MNKRFLCFLVAILIFGGIPVTTNADEPVADNYSEMLTVVYALDYLGTPYLYGGIGKSGLDCSGLLYSVFRNLMENPPRISKDWLMYGISVKEDFVPGDVLLFAENGIIFHVAIYVGDRFFIHAASAGPATGVIISSLDETYWSRYFYGARRIFS